MVAMICSHSPLYYQVNNPAADVDGDDDDDDGGGGGGTLGLASRLMQGYFLLPLA